MDVKHLGTEQLNANSAQLDQMSGYEIVKLMNTEDQRVPSAVGGELSSIASGVNLITEMLSGGGRLIYMGAGTSGRLGLMDAAECPPTFGTSEDLVFGLLAGGDNAWAEAVEGAEDDREAGRVDLERVHLSDLDVVVGISASGRTPYVLGGLEYARKIGARTISVSCNKNAAMSSLGDVAIEVDTGPEVLAGSTRLKAGTAQKMVLNMLSTASMTRLGKVYRNMLVDLRPSNEKLVDRACRIVMSITGLDYENALKVLTDAHDEVKAALVMAVRHVSLAEARNLLRSTNGFVGPLLDHCGENPGELED